MTTPEKFLQLAIVIALFVGVMAALLVLTSKAQSKRGELFQSVAFVLPAVLMIALGLLYPAIKTIIQSFQDAASLSFVGMENYKTVFTSDDQVLVLRNTAIWVILTPIAATFIGLIYAILIDRSRFEKFAKALIFLPMAISLVGASVIWKFVYTYRGPGIEQIGVLNAIVTGLGLPPQAWITIPFLNSVLLMVILVWIQTGFAMVILSAALRGIPEETLEAVRIDGANDFRIFFDIMIPQIWGTIVVVWTTITITVLKVFDIVFAMTGGEFQTQVLANFMYFWMFRSGDFGRGSAIAVLILLAVLPIMIWNIRRATAEEGTR
jgi:alpha-glucoside transport system permease protein